MIFSKMHRIIISFNARIIIIFCTKKITPPKDRSVQIKQSQMPQKGIININVDISLSINCVSALSLYLKPRKQFCYLSKVLMSKITIYIIAPMDVF